MMNLKYLNLDSEINMLAFMNQTSRLVTTSSFVGLYSCNHNLKGNIAYFDETSKPCMFLEPSLDEHYSYIFIQS